MGHTVRILLAVVLGFVIGGVANMAVLMIGMAVIPLPEGADVSSSESLAESMKLFKPINFVTPLLAHAIGTLVGGFVAAKIGASHAMRCAIAVGVCFFLAGVSMAMSVGGPTWFLAADLVLAYIPMAILGGLLAVRAKRPT